jgi:hypothetical protein
MERRTMQQRVDPQPAESRTLHLCAMTRDDIAEPDGEMAGTVRWWRADPPIVMESVRDRRRR